MRAAERCGLEMNIYATWQWRCWAGQSPCPPRRHAPVRRCVSHLASAQQKLRTRQSALAGKAITVGLGMTDRHVSRKGRRDRTVISSKLRWAAPDSDGHLGQLTPCVGKDSACGRAYAAMADTAPAMIREAQAAPDSAGRWQARRGRPALLLSELRAGRHPTTGPDDGTRQSFVLRSGTAVWSHRGRRAAHQSQDICLGAIETDLQVGDSHVLELMRSPMHDGPKRDAAARLSTHSRAHKALGRAQLRAATAMGQPRMIER